jgi:hypothetical protein
VAASRELQIAGAAAWRPLVATLLGLLRAAAAADTLLIGGGDGDGATEAAMVACEGRRLQALSSAASQVTYNRCRAHRTHLSPSNVITTSTPPPLTYFFLLPPRPPCLRQLFNLGKNVRLFFATYTLAQIRDCAGQIERFFLALPSPSRRDEAPDPAGRQRRQGRRGGSPRLRAARRAAAVATETARQAALAALASLYHGIGDVVKVPDQTRDIPDPSASPRPSP